MKQLSVIIICLFFSVQLWSQEKNIQEKITLNSGEIYVGKVVLKTADMIMIASKDGTRYQFQLTDVKKVESESKNSKKLEPDINTPSSDFGGIVELSAGIAKANNSFDWSPNTQLSLMFGSKQFIGQPLFLGVGVGYNNSYLGVNSQNVSFLPLFLRIQTFTTKKRTAPYIGIDAGYGLALTNHYGGGALAKLSIGIVHKISYKAKLLVGLYAGVQSFTGTLTDIVDSKPYTHYDQTSMNSIGLKLGFLF